MADVNVNIRGRDEGLGSQLDSLREKAQALGREVENLNKIQDMTPTEQKLTVQKEAQGTLRAQQSQIKSEYDELRQLNVKEYRQAEKSYQAGEMSEKDFKAQTQQFQESQSDLGKAEQKELINAEKEMNRHLRLIVREMIDKRKLDRERAQRDKKEFEEGGKGGTYGALVSENRELAKQKLTASTAEEVQEIDQRMEENKQRMNEMEGKDKDDTGRFDAMDATAMANAFANANAQSMAIQGAKAGGGLLGGAKGAGMAAGVIAAIWGTLSQSSQTYQAAAGLGALRGRGYTGATSMQIGMGEAMEGVGGLGAEYGLSQVDVLQQAEQKARRTGIVGNDIMRRTMNDFTMSKGMGVDVSVFDKFERFTNAQDEASEIALDVLNVLNNIHDSSLKEGDLATFGEKLGTMQTLMDIQRSKRDLIDTDESLRMLSAWEAIGLSQKGEKAGGFMQQTIQGLGEGGSDNLMLLKYEAAKRAHPELANDPAALRRFVRFNSDDPAYMQAFFQYAGRITGENQMARDDMMYSFFNPESEFDMTLYERAMTSGDFSQVMTSGKKLKGQRSGTMTQAYADTEAGEMVGGLDQVVAGFKEVVGDLSTTIENWFSSNSVDVNIASSQLGSLPVSKTTKGVRPK